MRRSADVRSSGSADLHWGPDWRSPLTVGRRRALDSAGRWQCGDRRRVRRLVGQFLRHSSMHGVQHLCPTDPGVSCPKKTFFRLFFAACVFTMLASVVSLVQQSFRAESVFISSTSKEVRTGREEDPYFPQFPTLILCRRPVYKEDTDEAARELIDYALISLGYPFTSLTAQERSLMVETKAYPLFHPGTPLPPQVEAFSLRMDALKARYEVLKNLSSSDGDGAPFDLEKFIRDSSAGCEDIFIGCVVYLLSVNCCDLFRPRMTSFGTCHSFDISEELLQFYREQNAMDFAFTFDLRSVEHPEGVKAVTTGYDVHLLDPRDRGAAIWTGGEAIVNGFTTVMKTQLTRTSRAALFTTWIGLGNDCPQLPAYLDPHGYGERYFPMDCKTRYLGRRTRELCGCRNILDTPGNASLRVCDPDDMYRCTLRFALSDNLTNMHEVCRNPCIEYNYKSQVNFFKIADDTRSRLVFVYDGAQYSLQEYKTTTLSGFLSQIGGALGLYLGASVITAVELLSFLVSWLWCRCLPRRSSAPPDAVNKNRVHPSSSSFYV